MTCPSCGRYSPPDPETGYDADELCPACLNAEECEGFDRAACAHQSALQDLATIGSEAATTSDRTRLWCLLEMARELETKARLVTDDLFARVEAVLAETEDPIARAEDSPF